MTYDTIIIGGGAAGLYAAAHSAKQRGLIIEKNKQTGIKLLMTGKGQCNLTHAGDIREFINCYGDNGKKIRSLLYKHSNSAVMSFFEERGLTLAVHEDGRVFPASLRAKDVRDLLLMQARKNGFTLQRDEVIQISPIYDTKKTLYQVSGHGSVYLCHKLIVATGGCAYPQTGSNGAMFAILKGMGIEIVPLKPALVPVLVQGYPYRELAGLSFKDVQIKCGSRTFTGDLLLAHKNFTGPVILNGSRWISQGDEIKINYLPQQRDLFNTLKKKQAGNNKMLLSVLVDLGLPKAFAEIVIKRTRFEGSKKFSSFTGTELKTISTLVTADTFIVSQPASYHAAMATAGGVSLEEIEPKTMQCKRYPNMHIIGEALDVDGDTGGYNLQFAFASGYAAVCSRADVSL